MCCNVKCKNYFASHIEIISLRIYYYAIKCRNDGLEKEREKEKNATVWWAISKAAGLLINITVYCTVETVKMYWSELRFHGPTRWESYPFHKNQLFSIFLRNPLPYQVNRFDGIKICIFIVNKKLLRKHPRLQDFLIRARMTTFYGDPHSISASSLPLLPDERLMAQ